MEAHFTLLKIREMLQVSRISLERLRRKKCLIYRATCAADPGSHNLFCSCKVTNFDPCTVDARKEPRVSSSEIYDPVRVKLPIRPISIHDLPRVASPLFVMSIHYEFLVTSDA